MSSVTFLSMSNEHDTVSFKLKESYAKSTQAAAVLNPIMVVSRASDQNWEQS